MKKKCSYHYTGIVLMLCILAIPVTATDIYEYPDTNLPGSDYKTVVALNKDSCANSCMLDNNCRAATWVHNANQDAYCLLKNAVPAITPVTGNASLVMYSFIKNDAVVTQTTGPCMPVAASFTAEKTYGTVPLSIHFIDTTGGAGETVWIWGDGSQLIAAPQSEVDHTYTKPGIYTVNLTARNSCSVSFATRTISVYGPEVSPARGILKINGVPDGAILSVDGIQYGIFPMNPMTVTAGSHTIRIIMSGYDDFTSEVMIAANQQFVLNLMVTTQDIPVTAVTPGSLSGSPLKKALKDLALSQAATGNKAADSGILVVSSNPAGANVYIDGKNGGITPLTVRNITPGEHNLLLTRQGYTDLSRSVNVSAGSETRVIVDMTATGKTPGFAAVAGVLSVALLVMFRRRTR